MDYHLPHSYYATVLRAEEDGQVQRGLGSVAGQVSVLEDKSCLRGYAVPLCGANSLPRTTSRSSCEPEPLVDNSHRHDEGGGRQPGFGRPHSRP